MLKWHAEPCLLNDLITSFPLKLATLHTQVEKASSQTSAAAPRDHSAHLDSATIDRASDGCCSQNPCTPVF
eukprot:2129870-Rhodomonas_salina.2